MAEELTLGELSERTGEPKERLGSWRELELIGRPDKDGFDRTDVARARLVQLCLWRGIPLEAIARANREQDFLGRYLELAYPQGVRPMYTVGEAAEIVGLESDLIGGVGEASGFFDQHDLVSDEQVEALRTIKALKDIGFPPEALVEGTRVYADSLTRVAEMEIRLFHFHVHERLKAQGLSGKGLMDATDAAGDLALPLIEPTVLFFHRVGWERAVRDDLVMHMAEEAGLLPAHGHEVPGEMARAIAFIDLASFTPLTAAMGDVAAAELLERFSRQVRQAVGRWEGRIVKQIGDAFMLVFPEPRPAVACALEIQSQVAKEPQFPAVRAGIHWGTVLYREGDYVGSNVNIASRLASEAARHQIVITGEVRKEVRELPNIEFVRLGRRKLKGLSGTFELIEVRTSGEMTAERAIDPVCGMELGPAEVAARLSLEGAECVFCSEACLRKFVASPESYDRPSVSG